MKENTELSETDPEFIKTRNIVLAIQKHWKASKQQQEHQQALQRQQQQQQQQQQHRAAPVPHQNGTNGWLRANI